MDGAKLFNAAVSLKCSLKEMTRDTGVDILSVGGTKIGLLFGEAVIFFKKVFAKFTLPAKAKYAVAVKNAVYISSVS
jgi:threonine aldolase